MRAKASLILLILSFADLQCMLQLPSLVFYSNFNYSSIYPIGLLVGSGLVGSSEDLSSIFIISLHSEPTRSHRNHLTTINTRYAMHNARYTIITFTLHNTQ